MAGPQVHRVAVEAAGHVGLGSHEEGHGLRGDRQRPARRPLPSPRAQGAGRAGRRPSTGFGAKMSPALLPSLAVQPKVSTSCSPSVPGGTRQQRLGRYRRHAPCPCRPRAPCRPSRVAQAVTVDLDAPRAGRSQPTSRIAPSCGTATTVTGA